jgi:Zn-dependent protease
VRIIALLPLILLSLSVHEFAHGYVSNRLGDPTPARAGRMSLNPLAHLDPLGTLALVLSSLTGFGLGWAKPVPINPRYYRNPLRGTLLVALAGPLANLSLAVLFALIFRWQEARMDYILKIFLLLGIQINLGLFNFNLIPIPPLDGSKVLAYFLRGETYYRYLSLERFGFLLIVPLLISQTLANLVFWPAGWLFRLLT